MALRAMYKGFKKVLTPLIINRPGELAIDQDALNTELNKVFFPRSEELALGASWNELEITASGKTATGVTFTVNADKSITFVTEAGGATADTSIVFNSDFQITDENTHYYSGVSNGAADKYYLECYYRDDSNTYEGNTRVYDGVIPIAVSDKEGATKINTFILMVKSGFISTTPINVYPMVAPKEDALYAPYAKTNKQLTENVATLNDSASDQKTAINAIITAATGAADFAAFKEAMGAITPVTRSIQVTPETREEITEPEKLVTVKKTTRKKSTAAADIEKEGE